MQPNRTFIILACLSITPLIYALCLALYHAFDLAAYTGYSFSFARINSFIYVHSYGALLLALFAGIQIGHTLQSQIRWYVIFNFILLWMAWLSYHSFADKQGVILLLCCWLAALIIDIKAQQQNSIPRWYGRLKLKLNTVVIILLLLLLIINH